MADNVSVTAGTIATDEVAGVHYQRIKIAFGADGAASDVSTSNKLPVDVGTVPVTGTFWQATQPISGTVAVSGSVAVTGAFYQATQPVSGTFWQATQPVSIASMPSTPVTGTFWQATQPVSGPLTDTQLRASAVPVSLTSTTVTGSVAVTGTFWQATQPVSLASLPALSAGTAAIGKLAANTGVTIGAVEIASSQTLGTVTTVSTVTNLSQLGGQAVAMGTGTRSAGTQRVTVATDDLVPVSPPTLTKATQGSTGFSVQDLKDAGRVIVNAATAIAGVAAVTTEALLALNVSRDAAATSGITTITVTSGKRFRVQAIVASVRSTAATVLSGRVSLRMNPSGAVTASSPIIATLSMTQQAAALAEAGDTCVLAVPDGIEFSGTMQFGLSQVCSGTGGVVYASIIGYEY